MTLEPEHIPVEQGSVEQGPIERAVFRKRHRLSGSQEFEAVFGARLKKSRGPLIVFLRASDRAEHRLGLSIGRKVGNAVVRGRYKRIIREVFRQQRSTLPRPSSQHSYDIVVSMRRHEAMDFEEYQASFLEAFEAAHRIAIKRVPR